ncbi:proline-rich membrane anchor 1 isoform X2 [Sphaerodactylus townsendi]|uniref:proline-rich membrane anchor 1 isoform X2 n=1 Tax=Sphaerodactylus townsendi TaxID=933632 RepID=UPI0020267BA1|nr:proline-rich membrane anchor 1 isoform X2 [Sphaerodactylus townsendi]
MQDFANRTSAWMCLCAEGELVCLAWRGGSFAELSPPPAPSLDQTGLTISGKGGEGRHRAPWEWGAIRRHCCPISLSLPHLDRLRGEGSPPALGGVMLIREVLLFLHCFWPSLLLHWTLHPIWGFIQIAQGEPQKSCFKPVAEKVTDSCQQICQCRPPPLPPPPPPPPPPRLLGVTPGNH